MKFLKPLLLLSCLRRQKKQALKFL